MTKTLEEKIEERKKQAKERNIVEKAKVVAEKLGKSVEFENDDAREKGHCYDNEILKVTRLKIDAFPTHGFAGRNFMYTFVEYNGETRFEAEDETITRYISGRWEERLDTLYASLTQPVEKREYLDKEAELRKRFGL